jgi:ABC-type antimicrobial peptide transport system permease subunit
LRRAIAAVDPGVPIEKIMTVHDLVSNSASQPRFRTAVIATFSLLALFVASLGLYGVMNYMVSQRVQEFGIRMALGASRAGVMRMVFRQAAKMVGIGIALGIAGTALLSRAVASLLYGVKPLDGLTLGSVVTLISLVAFFAVYFPARRAGISDPMESLRHD